MDANRMRENKNLVMLGLIGSTKSTNKLNQKPNFIGRGPLKLHKIQLTYFWDEKKRRDLSLNTSLQF
jgi:hypothetical protein